MYKSLYRRYRPQTFADVVGQSAAIEIITRAVQSETVSHAYLFSGPRGCGKTTIARLFAKAVNCPSRKGAEPCNKCSTCQSITDGNCLDVVEIDGASNNGVDQIRDLKDHVGLASFGCRYKVYIIDEVHMLSLAAFNALLKTLEEPPERVLFILATTEPHKVPVTIRSRCQHIPFHGMTADQIVSRLKHVLSEEKIKGQDEALWEIARSADGGMRDALSLLEQAIALGESSVSQSGVERLLGGGSSSRVRQWFTSTREQPQTALSELSELFRAGAASERFINVLFLCVRNLWLLQRWGRAALSGLSLSAEEGQWLENEKDKRDTAFLEDLMARLASALPQVRRGLSNDVLTGLLVEWCTTSASADLLPVEKTSPAVAAISKTEGIIPSPHQSEEKRIAFSSVNTPIGEKANQIVKSELKLSGQTDTNDTQAADIRAAGDFDTALSAASAAGSIVHSEQVLEKCLLLHLTDMPQVVIPLFLADIYRDELKFMVKFAPAERMSFAALDNERSAAAVRLLLMGVFPSVDSVELCCDNESKVYKDFIDAAAPHLSKKEEETVPLFTSPIERSVSIASAASSAAVAVSEKPVKKASPSTVSSSGILSLAAKLDDAELLYYRHSDSGEEETQE